jgi:hypothetical protein
MAQTANAARWTPCLKGNFGANAADAAEGPQSGRDKLIKTNIEFGHKRSLNMK